MTFTPEQLLSSLTNGCLGSDWYNQLTNSDHHVTSNSNLAGVASAVKSKWLSETRGLLEFRYDILVSTSRGVRVVTRTCSSVKNVIFLEPRTTLHCQCG